MLTNWETIRHEVERLKELERREESGALDLLPKKEASVLRRELGKLQKYLGWHQADAESPRLWCIVDQRASTTQFLNAKNSDFPLFDAGYKLRSQCGRYSDPSE
jgi:small subunit ribosomal protein S2